METRYEMKEEWKTQTELRSTKHQLMMLMRFYAGSQSRHEDSSSSIVGEVECGRDQATGSGARSCSEYCAKIAWWSFALTDAASLAFALTDTVRLAVNRTRDVKEPSKAVYFIPLRLLCTYLRLSKRFPCCPSRVHHLAQKTGLRTCVHNERLKQQHSRLTGNILVPPPPYVYSICDNRRVRLMLRNA